MPVANAPAPGPRPRPPAFALEQQLPTLLTQAAQAGAAAALEMQRSAAPPQPPAQSPEHPPHESLPSVAGAHLPLGARLEAELGPIDAERPPFPPMCARHRQNRNVSLSTSPQVLCRNRQAPRSSLRESELPRWQCRPCSPAGPRARATRRSRRSSTESHVRKPSSVPSLPVHATENPMPCHTPRNRSQLACWPLPPTCRRVGRHGFQPRRLLVRADSRPAGAPRHSGRPSRCARRSPVRAES